MRELSGLEVRLLDEYYRCERHLKVINRELEGGELRGYISKKVIGGKDRYYLQWREGDHVISQYISEGDLPDLSKKMERKKAFQQNIKELKHDMKIIRRALGEALIEEYRDKI